MKITLKEIADNLGGELIGDPTIMVRTITGLEKASPDSLVWIEKNRYLKSAEESEAAAIICGRQIENSSKPLIRVDNPRLAFAILARLFFPPRKFSPGISPDASISPEAKIGNDVTIQPRVVIESGVSIGDRSIIGAGSFIGLNSAIGSDTRLYPNVTVNENNIIGNNCIIHAGAVIGGDGFGYVTDPEGLNIKVPQTGRVVIGNNVEIGCNTTIDRATFGDTIIKDGVKIDNLVQIAHNDEIGENTILCAQVGISGSVKVGRNVVMAGQVGLADHVTIGDRVILLGQSGLAAKKKVPAGQILLGSPARSINEAKLLHAAEGRMLKKILRERAGRNEDENSSAN